MMSGISSNKCNEKIKRTPNTPSSMNYYTNNQLFPSHTSILYSKIAYIIPFRIIEYKYTSYTIEYA